MALTKYTGANQLVESNLMGCLGNIEAAFEADCLTYCGPIGFGADDDIREAVEAIEAKKPKLVFVLETDGGYAEAAKRISDTLRKHYTTVDFVVPNRAMSAGTILVMSGDAIHMDYYSVLGPIDPQVESNGKLIPALGYLLRYEKLYKKAEEGKITEAELSLLINGFDQGQLYSYEQARDLANSLLKEWLCKYKWKNWKATKTRGLPVDEEMKISRANLVSETLNDVTKWNSHGLGITMQQLRDVVGLEIDDFGSVPKQNDAIRTYHKLLQDYMERMRHYAAIHTRSGFQPLATISD